MKIGFAILFPFLPSLFLCLGSYQTCVFAANPPSSYLLTSMELSRDNGSIVNGWAPLSYNACVGDQYYAPSGGTWYLSGIKYSTSMGSWPESNHGFGVACWKFVNGSPGPIVWPLDGVPIFNPNNPGGWIIQLVEPNFNLTVNCPNGFLVGIDFLYSYPNVDDFGIDNTGVGPYDWAKAGGAWSAAPYGKGSARCFVNDEYNPSVENTTLGSLRALYH